MKNDWLLWLGISSLSMLRWMGHLSIPPSLLNYKLYSGDFLGIDSPSLLDLKDGSDAKGLSTSASCAPHSTQKDREKISSNCDPLEGPLSRKHEETQAKDTNGRPSSSASSSASDRPGAVSASSRPGLTPSSSVSSLSSEKSTLNPHAKV